MNKILPPPAGLTVGFSDNIGQLLGVLGIFALLNYFFAVFVILEWILRFVAYPNADVSQIWTILSIGSVAISLSFYALWYAVNKRFLKGLGILWIMGRLATWVTVVGLKVSNLVSKRPYWTELDDGIILGSLPLSSDVPDLVKLGVRRVINLCEEYRGPLEEYRVNRITQLYLPVIDYSPPTLEQIQAGVDAISEAVQNKERIYVHCKAGQGRSATIMLCYLLVKGMTRQEAQKYLNSKRKKVSQDVFRRPVVLKYADLSATDRAKLSEEAKKLVQSK